MDQQSTVSFLPQLHSQGEVFIFTLEHGKINFCSEFQNSIFYSPIVENKLPFCIFRNLCSLMVTPKCFLAYATKLPSRNICVRTNDTIPKQKIEY